MFRALDYEALGNEGRGRQFRLLLSLTQLKENVMRRKRIVFIGGGSGAWTPKIMKDMLFTESLRDSEFVLYDINKEAGDLVKAFLDKLNGHLKTKATIISTDNRARAFKGGDYFIITISTGGLNSMEHDIAIPEEYSIYHTVGDTSGPGGWARLMRNFGVFKGLAEAIERYAPGAMVLNYSNPMSTLTAVLSTICEGPVVGLCHGLFQNLNFLKDFYKLKSEDDFAVKYAGLNHFFWITEARTKTRDLMADLRRRIRKQGFTDLLHEAHADEMGYKSNRELATELFRLTDVMPYLGDRHTCEFFAPYITSKKNMRKYRIVRTPIAERKNSWKDRYVNFRKMIRGKIPEEYFQRSRETAADIISAHMEGRSFIDVGNLPNIGQIANLPLGTVVETAMRVDRNGFAPIAFGPLPEPVLGFVEPYTRVFDLGVEACFTRDKQLALQALRLDPVCSHLSADQVNEMGARLLQAHKRFITQFKV